MINYENIVTDAIKWLALSLLTWGVYADRQLEGVKSHQKLLKQQQEHLEDRRQDDGKRLEAERDEIRDEIRRLNRRVDKLSEGLCLAADSPGPPRSPES